MDQATTPDGKPLKWYQGLNKYCWVVLVISALGWLFDTMDQNLFTLVRKTSVEELVFPHKDRLHMKAEERDKTLTPEERKKFDADVKQVSGWVTSIFLYGWAAGGFLFGILGDRLGRTKTMIITILIYAVFTGLAALSETWWHLAIYRFLTALGVGGEWAAGAAIVAEVWPEEKRARAAGILQSAWAVGFFLAAAFNLLLSGYGWRVLFVVGVAPAVVALLVRFWVKEPERWVKAHAQEVQSGAIRRVKLLELFRGDLLRPTLVGSGLAFVAVFGLWGATNWTATLIRRLPDMQGVDAATVATNISYAIMWLNVGALAGYLSFGPLADRFGRRPVFALMCAGSFVMLPVIFLAPRPYEHVLLLLPLLGFFNNGIFSGFPIYLPELYPTRIRATGAGFCFNAGRLLAAVGPFLTGFLEQSLGSLGRAASAIALIYLVGLAILPFAPETRGKPLPE